MFEHLNRTTNKISIVSSHLRLWSRAFGLIWTAIPMQTALWVGLIVVQGVLPGLTVYLTKVAIDSFVAASSGSGDALPAYSEAGLFFALTGGTLLLTELFRFFGEWNRASQVEYFSDFIKRRIHEKSGDVDLEFYESPVYHDLMEQARGESSAKPLALLESLGAVAQNSITLISFTALLLVYGWAIPLLLVAGALPSLLITFRLDRKYHRWWKKTASDRRWLMYFDSMLTHSTAAAEMRLFGLGAEYRDRYQKLRERLRAERFAHLRSQFAGKVLATFISMAAAFSAIGWIALGVFYRTASLGDLSVFVQVFTRGQSILRGLLGGVGQSVNNTLYLESLFAYLDLESKVVSPVVPRPFPTGIQQGIRFRDVTFRYPGEDRRAISEFNLFIPAGQTVAIVGVNGAGKSTLIKLLCRFYDPEAGSIEIDGINIREFDVIDLRRNLSVLFQFPMQFHETVSDSIELGDRPRSPSRDRTREAAERAGAADFVNLLPQGYDTLLGKWFVSGVELSGGEWQKVALARAYFREAPIVVLDEPTSFMDPWSEADWFERFRSMVAGRMGIVITHRFTIAMRADVIHVVDDGRILESGTHQELLDSDGHYAKSWNGQLTASGRYSLPDGQYSFPGSFR